ARAHGGLWAVPPHAEEDRLMADWRKGALAALLAGGKIEDNEGKGPPKEPYPHGKNHKKEGEVPIELPKAAQKKAKGGGLSPAFEQLFFKAIEANVLQDGRISAAEAKWLRAMLYADGKIDANEKKFLARLKKSATKTSPAFDALCEECLKK